MRINRMKLIDFRSHADSDITFARLTCIRGANHSGKTSIAQGIEFALTGHTDSTDARGAGAAGLIRQGADKAVILMKLQANKEVDLRCTLTPASGRDVTIKDPNDAAWSGAGVKQWLDGQRAVLSCLLNSRYFIGLKPAEQKTLLSSIILPDSYEWPEWVCKTALKVHLGIEWNRAPFDVIEAAYKAAFDKRRDVNRDLKNVQIPDPIAMPEGVARADQAREELSRLRTKIYEVEREHREKLKERSGIQAKIAGLEQRAQALEAKIRGEQQALSQAEDRTLGKKQLKDAETTAGNEKKLAELERDLATMKEQAAGIRSILGIFQQLADKPCCPMCQREVTEDWLLDKVTPQNEALKRNLDKQEELLQEMKALGDVTGAKRKLEEHEQALASKKRSQEIIAETQSLLKTATEELSELRNALPPAPEDSEESKQLRTQITTLEGQLEKIAVAEARTKDIERAKSQHAQLTEASATLEKLVEYFGPKGVKAELLQEHIGGFISGMNKAPEPWGYVCALQFEPYGFVVTNLHTKACLSLELLSGSERLRFAVAFQVALAQVSGIRMVVVDEADLFDSEGRNAFYPLLLNADLDQAVAIGTDEREDVPEVEGAVFYLMQDGKAVQLEPAAAVA